MFNCQACKKSQPAGSKQVKAITETRKKTYENVVKRGKRSVSIRSEGWEIVTEKVICNPCAQKIAS